MRQNGEPSVEEILQSIKKVIARDTPGTHAARFPERESRCRYEDSVLELDEAEAVAMDGQDEDGDDVSLVHPDHRKSMQNSLAALAMLSEPGSRPKIVRSGETSLEEMVRDLLRPALAEWLDKNLPPMVERLVADEIARIVGKKG